MNPSAPQVFNFCAIWGVFDNQVGFLASTEEGALWVGTVDSSQNLSVIGYQNVFGSLGSALAFNFNGNLVVINYNLYEFTTSPSLSKVSPGETPSATLSLSIGQCSCVYEEPKQAKPLVREEAESMIVSALSVFFPSNEVFRFL